MATLLFAGAALLIYMSVLYGVALAVKNNGVADIGYGIGLMVVTAVTLFQAPSLHWYIYPIAILPFLWGGRLAFRIFLKNWGKSEDFRYRAWREAWGNTFAIRSYLQIYLLQGTVIFVVASPVLLSIIFPSPAPFFTLLAVGLFVWLIGFFFEVVGDFELDRFLHDPLNKGKIMMEGLWRYTRHPNYFGESTMWVGIAIMASGVSAYPFIGFVSPLLITFLLLKVSGVPMLEKRWEGNPEWEAYTRRTSVFFPLPPKSSEPQSSSL